MEFYSNEYQQRSSRYFSTVIKSLMIVNIAVYLVQAFFSLVSPSLYRSIMQYFGLWPNQVIEHFWLWQLITCAFLHDVRNVFHLLFNLLTLYFFGNLVEQHYGPKRFLFFYLCCAAFASGVFTLFHYFLGPIAYAIGASGAIMGVLVISACLAPEAMVYLYFLFPIRLKTLIWILIALDLYMVLQPYGGVAAAGHLGGALFGYLYYRSGRLYDLASARVSNYLRNVKVKLYQEYEAEQAKKYSKIRGEVDRLLEKIHTQGLQSLTPQEREFLQKASEEYRSKS